MSLIAKWALQLAVVVLVGWAAAVTAGWSGAIVNGTGNDRLAQLTQTPMMTLASRDAALIGHNE